MIMRFCLYYNNNSEHFHKDIAFCTDCRLIKDSEMLGGVDTSCEICYNDIEKNVGEEK